MHILVQSSTNPSEHRMLSLFNKQVEELVALMNLNLNNIKPSGCYLLMNKHLGELAHYNNNNNNSNSNNNKL